MINNIYHKKMKMKIIAYHLPQFHSTLENDTWWGKDFTEWNNVRNGKSLFKDHIQPNEPLNDNYYNMLDKETVKWQSELAKEYGIDGFCYYHYWFKGRKMLEKPIENLNEWKEIEQNYCLCWANHNWRRTWDGTDELLIRQEYGKEKEWKEHFEYLLKFFKDKRYITKDGKPIFLIYDSMSVPNCDKMIDYWQKLALENGLLGIYIIESLNNKRNKFLKNSMGVVIREPAYSKDQKTNFQLLMNTISYKIMSSLGIFKILSQNKKTKIYDYDKVWNNILRNAKSMSVGEKKIYQGSFLNWDNTPRHKNKGSLFKGLTKEKFKKNLETQKENCKKLDSEFVFFNAWNEWGEGMYLEPDKMNEYKYLNIIKSIVKEKN